MRIWSLESWRLLIGVLLEQACGYHADERLCRMVGRDHLRWWVYANWTTFERKWLCRPRREVEIQRHEWVPVGGAGGKGRDAFPANFDGDNGWPNRNQDEPKGEK